MRNECEIVKDLLPLYAEGLTSASSNEFIEEHLKTCPECSQMLEQIRRDLPAEMKAEEKELPLKEFSKIYTRKKRGLAMMIAALAASVIIAVYAWLSAPRYLDYGQAVESTEEVSDGLLITFKEGVHHIRTASYTDPDGYVCADIESWTSQLDQLWHAEAVQETLIRAERIWYRSNKDVMSGDVQMYGTDAGGSKSLRRLALNFYFVLAAGLSAVSGLAGFLLRQKETGVWFQKLTWIPFAWCLASLIVERGIGASTWSLIRDVSLIALLWICLSVFFLCLDQRLREKKAVRTES